MNNQETQTQNEQPESVPVEAVVRPPQLCTECGVVHAFRVPKFRVGQRVRLISEYGLNHYDKVGQETTIIDIGGFASMPCDEIEYCTEFGFGLIMERRLESV